MLIYDVLVKVSGTSLNDESACHRGNLTDKVIIEYGVLSIVDIDGYHAALAGDGI